MVQEKTGGEVMGFIRGRTYLRISEDNIFGKVGHEYKARTHRFLETELPCIHEGRPEHFELLNKRKHRALKDREEVS